MEIPHDKLNPDVLAKIIEEFVLREGTDYGDSDFSLEDKVAHVQKQLEAKKVHIVFDAETETVSIQTGAELRAQPVRS